MNKAEREELIQRNAESRKRILADMAARRKRQLAGDEPFTDDEPRHRPQRTLPANQGERQVREEYERHRPTMDTATQSLWENFIAAQCEAIITAKFDAFIDIVGEETGRSEHRLREELRSLRRPWRDQLHADLLKRFSRDFTAIRDDLLNVLRAELGLRGGNVVDLPNPFSRKA